MASRKSIGRLAGLLYLAHFLFFALADNGTHVTAVGSVDVNATVQGIAASGARFLWGQVSFALTAVFFFLAAWALYRLLKPINADVALLFVLLNLGGVTIWCSSQIFESAALFLADGADYLTVFDVAQRQSLSALSLRTFQHGYMISQILLNLWLFPLGYLVARSGFLPRVLGIALLIDGVAMLVWSAQFFFFPGQELIGMLCLALALLAEGAFCMWLLIRGARIQAPAQAHAGL